MKKQSLVRTIYLYIFTMLGLILLTIGGVRFIDMGLKAFIFTGANQEQSRYYSQPPYSPYQVKQIEKLEESEDLTEEEIVIIKEWLKEYKEWQEKEEKIDYVSAQRQKDASINISLILIGLSLYLYHWGIIRKETNNDEQS